MPCPYGQIYVYDYDSHVLIRDATFPDAVLCVDARPRTGAIAVTCQSKVFVVDGIKGSLVAKADVAGANLVGAKYSGNGRSALCMVL